jgi:UPF0716 protein FxsA
MMIVLSMFLFIVAMVIMEYWSITWVMEHTSTWKTLLMLLISAILGAGIARNNAKNSIKNLMKGMANGNPGQEMFNAVAMFAASALFIFPGFFSDIIALLLFIPLCRNIIFKTFFANSTAASEFSKGYNSSAGFNKRTSYNNDSASDVVDIVAETVEDSSEVKLISDDSV